MRGQRPKTILFYAWCIAGGTIALVLAVQEAREQDIVEIVGDVREERTPDGSFVTVDVRNRGATAHCPEIRIVARDNESRDLGEVVARPTTDDDRLEPGGLTTFEGVIRGLSDEDYEEKLREFNAYVYETRPCRPDPQAGAEPGG